MTESISARQIRPRGVAATVTAEREITETTQRRGVVIQLRNINRDFETANGIVHAVHDVNLSVASGEFCVLVGPSGCGKTTVLRMLSGLEQPTSGTIELVGQHGDVPRNAMVFQGRSVFPWLTVRENITYGLKLDGISRRERKTVADGLLKTVGLSRFGDAYPHQLSEGMRQRVAIARALAVDPDLLLMDEPFGALDEQTRLILQEELLRIWENTGKTVVFVTHSIDEALTLADRIVVMAAHPGTVRAIIEVPFSRPRSLTAIRSDPAFADLFTEIWSLLRTEVNTARQQAKEILG